MENNHGYIKALSVHNTAELVYARQCFHQPGMLEGYYMQRMHNDIIVVPDAGWIVWFDKYDGTPVYDVFENEEFLNRFVPYNNLPPHIKCIADAHPDYIEWCDIQDRLYIETQNDEAICPKN